MKYKYSHWALALTAAVLLLLMPARASAQEVGLVTLDVDEVARGYRANALKLRPVVNDKGEIVGEIDDFIFGHAGFLHNVAYSGKGGEKWIVFINPAVDCLDTSTKRISYFAL